MTPGQASLVKVFATQRGREAVAIARELQGGNGILYEYGVARMFLDMEGKKFFFFFLIIYQ